MCESMDRLARKTSADGVQAGGAHAPPHTPPHAPPHTVRQNAAPTTLARGAPVAQPARVHRAPTAATTVSAVLGARRHTSTVDRVQPLRAG